jgi:uncharacterized protein YuzE
MNPALRIGDVSSFVSRLTGSRGWPPGMRRYILLRVVLEAGMKVKYDPEVDVLSILLSDAPVEESGENKPGVILDYDMSGDVAGLEILDASKRMGGPLPVEYAVTR